MKDVKVKLSTLRYNVVDKDTKSELWAAEIKMPTETDEHWADIRAWFAARKREASRELGVKI